jgi:citronellol/citronellal dehydrogenase
VTLGLAAEFAAQGVAINALWPRTIVATDALNMIPGVPLERCRKPDIVADAVHAVLVRPARERTGAFLIDEEVLREAGVTDFSQYAVDPAQPLLPDLFLG